MRKFRWKFWRPDKPAEHHEDLGAVTDRNVTAIVDLYAAMDSLLALRMRKDMQITQSMKLVYGAPVNETPPVEVLQVLERLKEVEDVDKGS